MECGDLYVYRIGDRVQQIRKEHEYYVCFADVSLELLHLREHTFQVLRCTVEQTMDALVAWMSERFPSMSEEQIRVSIKRIQDGLVDVGLLEELNAGQVVTIHSRVKAESC